MTGQADPTPFVIPVGELLEGLPCIFIIANQLGKHHDFIPVVVEMHFPDALFLEFLESISHDFNSHIAQDYFMEVGLQL